MLETIFFIRPTFIFLSASVGIFAAFLRQRKPPINASRFAACFVIFVSTGILDYLLLDMNGLTTALEPFLHLAAILLLGVSVFRLDWTESMYYMTWCYFLSRLISQSLLPFLSAFSNTGGFVIFKLAVFFAAECIIYFFVKHFLSVSVSAGRKGPARKQSLLMAASTLAASLIFADHHFIVWLMYGPDIPNQVNRGGAMIGIFRFIFDMLCMAVMYIQCGLEHTRTVEQELFTVQQLWQHQQNQYEHSRENIDLINQKCHDMKYQIHALRFLGTSEEREEQIEKMEHSIMIYDSVMKTGEPALDTVLTEKSLFCENHGITLTCMADGEGLRFMSRTDLYTIMGNALDNAIESVMKYPEQEKRVIQISIQPKGRLYVIRVRNYCEQQPVFVEGLPVSTKERNGYHGFGLKSIRMIAENYNGNVTCTWEENSFLLIILLSAPEREIE